VRWPRVVTFADVERSWVRAVHIHLSTRAGAGH
jgi:hypothetical protein